MTDLLKTIREEEDGLVRDVTSVDFMAKSSARKRINGFIISILEAQVKEEEKNYKTFEELSNMSELEARLYGGAYNKAVEDRISNLKEVISNLKENV